MVTRIRDTDVTDSPAWPENADENAALLDGRILVAHNASVEHRVISTRLPDWQPPMVPSASF